MASIQRRHATFRCSFCGKGQDHVRRLIAGPGGVHICDECVALREELGNLIRLTPSHRRLTPAALATIETIEQFRTLVGFGVLAYRRLA